VLSDCFLTIDLASGRLGGEGVFNVVIAAESISQIMDWGNKDEDAVTLWQTDNRSINRELILLAGEFPFVYDTPSVMLLSNPVLSTANNIIYVVNRGVNGLVQIMMFDVASGKLIFCQTLESISLKYDVRPDPCTIVHDGCLFVAHCDWLVCISN